MKVKQAKFRDLFTMRGIYPVYPKNAIDNQPHITFEPNDVASAGDSETEEYEISKFQYTYVDPRDNIRKLVGFTESGGFWKCDRQGRVPPALRKSVEAGKVLAKQFVAALGGTCQW